MDKVAFRREVGTRQSKVPAEPFVAAVGVRRRDWANGRARLLPSRGSSAFSARGYSRCISTLPCELSVAALAERRVSGSPEGSPSRVCGFTLVELLAVVAIMAIILMAAVPIFQTLGKRDLNVVGTELRTTFRLARQMAVAQRRYVYVVFPDSRAANTPETLQHCLRSYAVISTNPVTGTWEYLTEWKFLPKGVYFVGPAEAFTGNVLRTSSPLAPFPNDAGPNRIMPGFCFTPSGKALYGGTNSTTDISIYFTTAHFYTTNATGTALVGPQTIPGVTNNVRVRVMGGHVDFRPGQQF